MTDSMGIEEDNVSEGLRVRSCIITYYIQLITFTIRARPVLLI